MRCEDGVRDEGVGVECLPNRSVGLAVILSTELSQLYL